LLKIPLKVLINPSLQKLKRKGKRDSMSHDEFDWTKEFENITGQLTEFHVKALKSVNNRDLVLLVNALNEAAMLLTQFISASMINDDLTLPKLFEELLPRLTNAANEASDVLMSEVFCSSQEEDESDYGEQ